MMLDGHEGSSTRKARVVPLGNHPFLTEMSEDPADTNVLFLIQSTMAGGSREHPLGLARLPTPVPPMPIHAHLRDLLASCFTKQRSPRFDPFAGSAPPKGAFELRGKPGSHTENLARAEPDFRLVVRDITPVGPNCLDSVNRG